jgi:hypothetical protein
MALTTLAAVKAELGMTTGTNDTMLTNMIEAMSTAIENYLDRTLIATDHVEYINARERQIFLRNMPINKIYYAGYDQKNAGLITYTGSTVASINIGDTGVELFNNLVSVGVFTYVAYPTVSTLLTAIDGITDFDTTLIVEAPTKLMYKGSMAIPSMDTSYLVVPAYQADLCKIWDGLYTSQSFLPHVIYYNGGFSVIPADIVEVINRAVITMWKVRKVGPFQSESITSYSYTLGQFGTIAYSILRNGGYYDILNFYRTPTI